jgi:CheY-like chemotaxis protein
MISGAELLSLGELDGTMRRTLERMIGAGARMTALIDQLLDLTRARLGGGVGFVRTRTWVDIKELVQRTVEELRGANAGRAMTVESAGDATTVGDPERLVQLFSNLVGNALTHGRPDEPITATVVGRDRDVAVIVHNHGEIPPELISTLFEPFHGRPQRASNSGGLGLGMFIARQIAHAHGGDISVESSPATGTTVTVQLPRHGDATEPVPKPKPAAQAVGSSPSVLIVEDEVELRETLRELLEAKSYRVATAANGEEALAVLATQPPPDVVIFDLVMPILDGNAFYRAMQRDPRLAKIPVLVSTGDPSRAPRGLVVLQKPVEIKRILDEVALLGIKRGIAS